MLWRTLAASILGNVLTGKPVIRVDGGLIKASENL